MDIPWYLISCVTRKLYIFRGNNSQLVVKFATDGRTYNLSIRLIFYCLQFKFAFPKRWCWFEAILTAGTFLMYLIWYTSSIKSCTFSKITDDNCIDHLGKGNFNRKIKWISCFGDSAVMFSIWGDIINHQQFILL